TPFAIAVVESPQLIVRFGNRAFERIPFLKTPEALERPLKEVLRESEATRSFLAAVESSVKSPPQIQVVSDVEFRADENAPPTSWVFKVVPFGEKENAPDQFLLLWQDVSAEKSVLQKVENERREANRLASELQVILNNMGDGVIVVNQSKEATIINDQARGLLGITKDLRLPQPLSAMGKEISQSLDIEKWRNPPAVPPQGPGLSRVSLYPTEAGRLVEIVGTAILERAEKPARIESLVGVLHDITEYKKVEREKDEFLSLASHELKTPLTVLDTSSQIIDRAVKSGNLKQIEAANAHILPQFRRLKLLILQLFDFANIQSERMQLRSERMDLGRLVSQVVEDARCLSPYHELAVEVPRAPLMVLIDVTRIEQVLNNLISNAIRYSPRNSKISVKLDIAGKSARTCISDHGIGIAPEDLLRLFRRYSRGSNVGNVAGMGIGLYVASELIRAHGGRIWAESAGVNQGSQFCFELPLLGENGDGKSPHPDH
ncbi:MAG: ATP-binding protein, partial [Bdellovibrionota bacterium]